MCPSIYLQGANFTNIFKSSFSASFLLLKIKAPKIYVKLLYETRPVLDRFHDSSKVKALSFMLYALCFMHYVLCSMLYALGSML